MTVAVVTGGTGWLGSAISEALLEMGMDVYAVSRGRSKDFTGDFNQRFGFRFRRIMADLSTKAGVDFTLDAVLESHSTIDVLVNNSHAWSKVLEFGLHGWDELRDGFEADVISPLYMTQSVVEFMKGYGTRGSIVNVLSMYGKVAPDISMYHGAPGMGNPIDYGMGKAALGAMTRYVASVGGKHGIRCNSISPGPISRPGSLDGKDWFRDELNSRTMLGRVGTPQEIKGAIKFLCGDGSSYVTGIDIPIDGGWTAR